MNIADVSARLAPCREELARLGVARLMVFGSVARGEAGPDSDVDVLVDFDRPVGLFAFAGLKRRLEEIVGRRVDLVTRGGLRPELRSAILAEARDAA
jgi:predicted nucleotidyltransferase